MTVKANTLIPFFALCLALLPLPGRAEMSDRIQLACYSDNPNHKINLVFIEGPVILHLLGENPSEKHLPSDKAVSLIYAEAPSDQVRDIIETYRDTGKPDKYPDYFRGMYSLTLIQFDGKEAFFQQIAKSRGFRFELLLNDMLLILDRPPQITGRYFECVF